MTLAADELEQRLFQLETLYDIGRECANRRTLPDVLRVMLAMLAGAFGAVRGVAFAGDASGRVDAVQARGLPDEGRLSANVLAQSFLLAPNTSTWSRHARMELCATFDVDGSTRGAIALGPRLTGAPYTDDDRQLVQKTVDTAAPYLQNVKLLAALQVAADALSRRVQALATVNEIALGIAAQPSARRLYRFLTDRVTNALDAAEGALVLPEDEGWSVAAHVAGDDAAPPASEGWLIERLQGGDGEDERPYELVAPVRYGGESRGALWLRRDPTTTAFDADDLALLEFLATQTGLILENSRLFETFLTHQQEQFRLRGMLEQYLAPSVAERLITGETRPALEGTRLPVSVLMVDMRGSTELITHVEPEVMVILLNQYLGRMTDVLFHYEGTIDKFAGDAVLGFFGAPEGHPDDPVRALRAGARMQREFSQLLAEWQREYTLPASLGIGVGIATGEVVVGNIGSAKRLEHTIIGPAVNLAARLTSRAPAGTVQIDEATWSAASTALAASTRARVRRPRYLRAKGFAGLVPVYRLRPEDVSG